jgi:hypothetical protein
VPHQQNTAEAAQQHRLKLDVVKLGLIGWFDEGASTSMPLMPYLPYRGIWNNWTESAGKRVRDAVLFSRLLLAGDVQANGQQNSRFCSQHNGRGEKARNRSRERDGSRKS